MPVVESRCVVPVDAETAFAISQTTGEIRLRWDPFIRRQHFLGGALVPAKGVRTLTVQRHNFTCTPRWLAPLAERIGAMLLQHDIDRRIRGFARGCEDPVVLAAVAR
jgi:predicted ATPase